MLYANKMRVSGGVRHTPQRAYLDHRIRTCDVCHCKANVCWNASSAVCDLLPFHKEVHSVCGAIELHLDRVGLPSGTFYHQLFCTVAEFIQSQSTAKEIWSRHRTSVV